MYIDILQIMLIAIQRLPDFFPEYQNTNTPPDRDIIKKKLRLIAFNGAGFRKPTNREYDLCQQTYHMLKADEDYWAQYREYQDYAFFLDPIPGETEEVPA